MLKNMLKIDLSYQKVKYAKIFTGIVILLLLFLIPVFIHKPYYLHIFILAIIYIIVVCSLRTVALSGQVSIGHAAFMAIGAYASGILAKQFGLTPWLTIFLGAVVSMLFALAIGFPFTRVRAFYFSMVSLFGGIAIMNLIRVAEKWTGATSLAGIPPLDSLNIPGIVQITFSNQKAAYYYFILIVALLCLAFLYSLEHSRIGMTWKAISQSHQVASSVGINESRYRVLALAVGCFFSGLAGACYAHYNLVLTPSTFGFLPSIYLVMYMLVGGLGSFWGPVLGTAIFVLVPEIFRWMKEYTPLLVGGIMVIVVFLLPKGMVSLFYRNEPKIRKIHKKEALRYDA